MKRNSGLSRNAARDCASAASPIAPVWLQLLDFTGPIPNLSGVLLASHLLWGGRLGQLTALGYRYLHPAR